MQDAFFCNHIFLPRRNVYMICNCKLLHSFHFLSMKLLQSCNFIYFPFRSTSNLQILFFVSHLSWKYYQEWYEYQLFTKWNFVFSEIELSISKIFLLSSMIITGRPLKHAILQLFYIVFLYCNTKYAIDMAS